MRTKGCWALVAWASVCVLALPAHAQDAAHTLADKFAAEAERSAAKKAEEQRKAEDARKAEEVRKREAELKADAARKEAAAKRAEAMRKADEDKARAKAKQAQGPKRPPQLNPAEEEDMLSRAKREAEEMQAAEEARILAEQDAAMARTKAQLQAAQAAEQERAKAEALTREKAAEAAQETARQKLAADAAAAESERQLVEWTRRTEATRRMVRSLNKARQIREARLTYKAKQQATLQRSPVAEPLSTDVMSGHRLPGEETVTGLDPTRPLPGREVQKLGMGEPKVMPPSSQPHVAQVRRAGPAPGPTPSEPIEPATGKPLSERTVTVLIVMAPGNYGIRRNGPKVADTILCTYTGCFVSMGPSKPAQFLPGRKALGFTNTLGARAGACRQKLGCIFRGIELDKDNPYLQPVDMHILKHDRRRGTTIETDSGCRVDGDGNLSCGRGIYAEDYAMWVIPESMADRLGPAALERALEDGLAAPRAADLTRQHQVR